MCLLRDVLGLREAFLRPCSSSSLTRRVSTASGSMERNVSRYRWRADFVLTGHPTFSSSCVSVHTSQVVANENRRACGTVLNILKMQDLSPEVCLGCHIDRDDPYDLTKV